MTEDFEAEMNQSERSLRVSAAQAIARSGGDKFQALDVLLRDIATNQELHDNAVRLGAMSAIHTAQVDMRNAIASESLDGFMETRARERSTTPRAEFNVDLEKMVGRYRYPLHKSGLWIGLADESALNESLSEVDRQLEGLQSSRAFESAVLSELKKRRKSPTDIVGQVLARSELECIFDRYKGVKGERPSAA